MLHCTKHNGTHSRKRFQFAVGQTVCLPENLVMTRIKKKQFNQVFSSPRIFLRCACYERLLLQRVSMALCIRALTSSQAAMVQTSAGTQVRKPSSAYESLGGFSSRSSGFCPPLLNDRLDVSDIFLKGP